MSFAFSKSRYCTAVQCPKMLWLKVNKPEEFDDSVINEAVMETGLEVGDLAMGLFGEYVEVPYGDLGEMIAETDRLLAAGTPIIAEASFSYDGLFCSVDILKILGDKVVELYEVKSATSVHDIYYHDVAYQLYVLTKLGYTVKRCCIVHVNRGYERIGALNIGELFTVVDVSDEAWQMQDGVKENIDRFREVMPCEDEPDDDIGRQCFKPYDCGFFKYCTRCLAKPNVFDLSGVQITTKFKLYNSGTISFEDLMHCGKLSAAPRMQIEHELTDCPAATDGAQIRNFLGELSYPLYFLDFESFQPAIPQFDHTHPYDQIAFQYSLHSIESPGGDLRHREFLAYPGSDPRRMLAEQLCRDIPMDVCTTAYNMSFEKSVIRGLAELYPDLSAHLMNIHDNIRDLMVPFQKKWYYCRAMQGSYSIKYVLPALFPNDPSLDYHNLEGVHNGGEASDTFSRMAEMSPEELEIARANLLRYCGLDTLAMVKIWQKLHEVVDADS